MAENESLNVSLSRLWKKVVQSAMRGEQLSRIGAKLVKALQRNIANFQKQMAKYGGAEAFMRACLLSSSAAGEIERDSKHDIAGEARRLAQSGTYTTVGELAKALCEHLLNVQVEKMAHFAWGDRGIDAYARVLTALDEASTFVRPKIDGLVEKFASDPNRVVNLPQGVHQETRSASMVEHLNESLIGQLPRRSDHE